MWMLWPHYPYHVLEDLADAFVPVLAVHVGLNYCQWSFVGKDAWVYVLDGEVEY